MMSKTTKVVTGMVRFSYLNVFEPKAVEEGQTPKYSVSLLIPKKDKKTIKAIQDAIQTAIEEGKGKLGNKIPANLKTPLRDGDEDRPDDEVYAGMMFLNANSPRRPGLVDLDLNEIIDRDEIYSGAWGRASVNMYAYNVGASKGIACGLNNLQKLKDDERLGGGSSAEEDFGSTEDSLMD